MKREIPLALVLKDTRCIDKPPWLGLEALDPQCGCPTAVQNPAVSSRVCINQICLLLARNILTVRAVKLQVFGVETLLQQRCSLQWGGQEPAGGSGRWHSLCNERRWVNLSPDPSATGAAWGEIPVPPGAPPRTGMGPQPQEG